MLPVARPQREENKGAGNTPTPAPSAGGRVTQCCHVMSFDVGISNTNLMWETDVRLTFLPAEKRVRQVSLQGVVTATGRASRSLFTWGGNQSRNRLPKFVGKDRFDEVRLRSRAHTLSYVTRVSCG